MQVYMYWMLVDIDIWKDKRRWIEGQTGGVFLYSPSTFDKDYRPQIFQKYHR